MRQQCVGKKCVSEKSLIVIQAVKSVVALLVLKGISHVQAVGSKSLEKRQVSPSAVAICRCSLEH